MRGRPTTLRTLLASVTVLVALLAILAVGALMVLTSLLHRTTVSLGAALETVRLVEEAQIDLLLHGRADDALVRREIEGNLRRKLLEAARYTNGKDNLLLRAQTDVDAYLKAASKRVHTDETLNDSMSRAFSALDDLVNQTVAEGRGAQTTAARIDYLANLVGLGIGALVILLAGLLLFWVRHSAFRPILRLAQTMQRFGRGERTARAEEAGPAELREMAQRFNEMATAISGQRDAQAAFLAGVAHDLRNPLSVLQMSLTTLRPEDPLPPEPRLRRMLSIIERQILRLERMLGDFLDMAKIEAGQLELRPERCSLDELVRQVVELFETSSSGRFIELSLPAEPIHLHCDPLRIEQVLNNLISNAIKYSPPESKIRILLERVGDEAVVSVTDNGMGISKADQQHLFEPFRRMGLSRELVPGVGLGLFVVRRIVNAHGGRITLDSAPGKGSTFRAHLPLRATVESTADVSAEHV